MLLVVRDPRETMALQANREIKVPLATPGLLDHLVLMVTKDREDHQ